MRLEARDIYDFRKVAAVAKSVKYQSDIQHNNVWIYKETGKTTELWKLIYKPTFLGPPLLLWFSSNPSMAK